MLIQFTVQDLLVFVGCVLLGIIAVLLICVLWKANQIMGTVRKSVDANRDAFEKTVQSLPGIMENAEQISKNLKVTTDQLSVSGPVILKDVEYVTNATKNGVDIASSAIINVSTGVNDTVDALKQEASELSSYFHLAAEIIKIIIHAFSSGK